MNETIATYLKIRASELEVAISRLVFTGGFKKKFYDHPLIKSLVKKDRKAPSYIEARTFAKVVTDIIQTNGNVEKLQENKTLLPLNVAIRKFGESNRNEERQKRKILGTVKLPPLPSTDVELLLEFANDAGNNVEDFKKKLETWFNEAMDRASGWYQRKIKTITLVISLVVTILFNVDSIEIYKTLSTNNKVRGEVIVAAAGYLDNQVRITPDSGSVRTATELKKLLAEQVDSTKNVLGIGWPHDSNGNIKLPEPTAPIGWLLTVIALSLGAPFWFDLLSKAMKLRGTGTQVPTKSPEGTTQPVG
ncbi:MAG: hypothetical protein WDO14_06335 [Bacteroidota bacterium]